MTKKADLEALLARYAKLQGPPKTPNGDHITLDEIKQAHESQEPHYPALYILCDHYRAVDVYHALQREADLNHITPIWIDEDKGYILLYRPIDDPHIG